MTGQRTQRVAKKRVRAGVKALFETRGRVATPFDAKISGDPMAKIARSRPVRSPLLLDQMADRMSDALRRVVAWHGSWDRMRVVVCIPTVGTHEWTIAQPHYVVRMAASTGYDITPNELREDIYPYPDDAVPHQLRPFVLARHAERLRMRELARAKPTPDPGAEATEGEQAGPTTAEEPI